MAEHVHTTPNRQPPKAAAYRSDPMPETALQILVATAAWLDARGDVRSAHAVRTGRQTRAELRTKAVIDLAAYREARA